MIGGVLLVALAIWMFWPSREKAETTGVEDLDPAGRIGGADGFPLPPLDLQVPVSPRAKQLTAEREEVKA